MQRGSPRDGVSVVMVSYWTGAVLSEAIESVLARDQEGVIELILVDNGNPHEVTADLARWAVADPRLRLISGHGNVGFARGCNIGAREARGRHLLLLNPDCRLAPGAIPVLLAESSSLGEEWMLGCRVLNPDGSDQRGSRRALLTPYNALVEALRLDRLAPRRFLHHRLNHHERPLPESTTRVPVVNGALMMLPTATFRAVGGMDEGFFLHVDDLDLCLRLHKAGVPVYFAPGVKAIHHAGSSRISPVRIEWYKARGFLRYFWLHYRGLRWLPLHGPLCAAILVRFGLKGMRSLLDPAWNRRAPREPRSLPHPWEAADSKPPESEMRVVIRR